MDLLYLPDSFCYPYHLTSFGRNNRTWEDVNINSGKDKKEKSECSKDSKNCSICKSRQKRSLSTYIMKTRRDSDRDRFAEEEEEEEDCNKEDATIRVSNPNAQEGVKSSVVSSNKCRS